MADEAETKAVAPKGPVDNLRSMLEKVRPQIEAVMRSKVAADDLLQVALVAASRQPQLFECSTTSFIQATMQCAELGLRFGPLGLAYLVPFENRKTGHLEAQLIVGFKGYVDLARENKQTIQSEVVHEHDEFEYDQGSSPFVRFKRTLGDRGKVIGAYAIAHEEGMVPIVEIMSLKDLEAIRERAKSSKSPASPYNTSEEDREQMYRKAPVRRIQKYLRLSPRQQKALEYDQEADLGSGPIIDVTPLMKPAAKAEPVATSTKKPAAKAEPAKPPETASKAEPAAVAPAQPTAESSAQPFPQPAEVDPEASKQATSDLLETMHVAVESRDLDAFKQSGTYFVKNYGSFTGSDMKRLQAAYADGLKQLTPK